MKTNYTITPYWDARVKDNDGKSRVLLTINLNRQQFRISIKVKCTQAEFKSAMNTRSANAKELRKVIQEYVDKAERILERLPNAEKDSFVRMFKSESDLFTNTNKTEVFYFFDFKISEANAEQRFSSAKIYEGAKRALKSYVDTLYFEDVDVKWLKSYYQYLLNTGNSASTISIKLRYLKSVFNEAIKQGFISEKHYPFKKFSVGCNAKSKSVLYPEQIKALWLYSPKTLRQERAKAYFFWCYFANGMNFKDLANLKWRNIKGDILTFIRSKTKNSTNDVLEIEVHLNEEMKRIIRTWGNTDKSPDAFVFPIMTGEKTPERMEVKRLRLKRVTNKSLAEIGKELKLSVHLCLHLARHSFATTLKLNGTPISFISDMMGHTSMRTTQHYLKSIPTDELRNISSTLMTFA